MGVQLKRAAFMMEIGVVRDSGELKGGQVEIYTSSVYHAEAFSNLIAMESKTGLLAFSNSYQAVQSKTGPLIILNVPVVGTS